MTGPSVVAQTVKINADTNELNAKLAEGIKHLRLFGQTVDETNKIAVNAFRSEAEELKKLAASGDASLQNMARLSTVTKQFESQIESAAEKTAHGSERMAHGFLYIAETGNLAGRGMATILTSVANLAVGFGPQGALIGAVTLAGLAFYNFFDKSAERAEKLQKAIDKVIDSTDRLKVAAVATELQGQLQLAQGLTSGTTSLYGGQDVYGRTLFGLLAAARDAAPGSHLAGQAGLAQAGEVRAGQVEAARVRLDEARKRLEDTRSEALEDTRALTKAVADGDLRLQQYLGPVVAAALGRAQSADSALKALVGTQVNAGSIAQMLKLNSTEELAKLAGGDTGFRDELTKAGAQGDIEIAQKAAEKAEKRLDASLKAVGLAIDKKSLEDPFVAAVLGVPMTKDHIAKYNSQVAESARLMQLAGFGGGPGMLGDISETQVNKIFEAWKTATRFAPKVKDRLAPGGQFNVPDAIAALDKDRTGYGGEDVTGGHGLGIDLTDFTKGFDKAIDKYNALEQAGKAAYNALSRGATNAINQIIETHKLAIGPIKRALGEPIVSFLEALAVRKYAEFVADLFTAPQKAAGDLAGAAAATAGAITVGEIMGTGGGGRGGSGAGGGGGGAGSTSDREHRNAGAALGRGRDDGGVTYLDITITQKDMNGREIARLNQQQQRTQDRNQPNRLVL